jgi:hypothetical protein
MTVTPRTARRAVAALLLVGAAGCGTRMYPVTGKVTFPDGTPLAVGTVVFERVDGSRMDGAMARGNIRPDGSYELRTSSPGDGALPGRYRVLISPPNLLVSPEGQDSSYELPCPFDPKFRDFSTSGLEYDVQPGRNEFNIQVAKNKTQGRPKGAGGRR